MLVLLCVIEQNGVTALTIASSRGYLEMVQLLLERGGDINRVTEVSQAMSVAAYFSTF